MQQDPRLGVTDMAKKVYVPPTLTSYGSVAKLTQNSGGSLSDSSPTNPMMDMPAMTRVDSGSAPAKMR